MVVLRFPRYRFRFHIFKLLVSTFLPRCGVWHAAILGYGAEKMGNSVFELDFTIGTMAEQHEKAFQKQDAIFIGAKRAAGVKKAGKLQRYWKNVGLSIQTPKEAKEGRYVDKKCPFTGNVSIRGKILKGMCISSGKMKGTIVMRRTYLHYIKKFNRFEKRHSNIPVHCSPAFDCREGDIVTAGQCRPLSKTVRFNVIKIEKNQIFGSARKQFRLF